MALALLVLASTTAAQPVGLGLNANRIPVAAAAFLQRHQPPGPMLPPEIVRKTRQKYIEAYERLTDREFH